jgi:hypothetical protein
MQRTEENKHKKMEERQVTEVTFHTHLWILDAAPVHERISAGP